jgi:predicted Zn-dependent protease
LPGGKVFVFSGILPICQDENGLAAVLGHEIAHNVAHHAAERISRSSIVMLSAFAVSFIFDVSGQFGNSIASLILSLPNSRTQEAEADHIGLLMMAEACYDPQAALDFWARMKKAEQFEPPQFMSTHPSHYNRAEQIKKWLPDAQRIYADTGCGSVSRYATDFKEAIPSGQSRRQSQLRPQGPVATRRTGDDEDDDFF